MLDVGINMKLNNYDCKFLAFSCLHSPLHSEEHVEALIKHNQDHKPHEVINLGDLYEASSASKWCKEDGIELRDEYKTANNILKRIRQVNPDAKYTFLEGNHDANILAKDRLPQGVRSLLDYNEPQTQNGIIINDELVYHWKNKRKYIYHKLKGAYRLGAVCFSHGFEAGASSDEMQALYFNQDWANSLFISGHTHRPTEGQVRRVMKTKGRGLPFWYLNAGCSCNIDLMDYMDRKNRAQWGNGYVYGSCDVIRSPRLGKTWEAHCVVTKMFDE